MIAYLSDTQVCSNWAFYLWNKCKALCGLHLAKRVLN